jgi:GABA(A) receptor-associated protein
MSFKQRYPFTQRRDEVVRILNKYPDRLPIVCEQNVNIFNFNSTTHITNKNKFLVPNDFTVGQFIWIIRQQFNIKPEMALFIFINNYIPSGTEYLYTIYNRLRDPDGFLYITYSFENTFG